MKKLMWGAVIVIVAVIIYVIIEFEPTGEEPPPSSTIEIVQVIVDDSETGDGNGKWSPGETIKVRVEVTNKGPDFIGANRATIEALHQDVSVEVGEVPISTPPEGPPGFSPSDSALVGDFVVASDSASTEAAFSFRFSVFNGAIVV
ncbi:MAG: hypothetical protein ACE5G1_12860, partial [bacterium]